MIIKKNIIIFLSLAFMLSGCSGIQGKTDSNIKEKEINQIDVEFQKKKECANYKDDMMKDAQSYKGDTVTSLEVREIFYSKKGNTCMYIIQYGTEHSYSPSRSYLEVIDFLSKKSIDGIEGEYNFTSLYGDMLEGKCKEDLKYECKRLLDKILELKG